MDCDASEQSPVVSSRLLQTGVVVDVCLRWSAGCRSDAEWRRLAVVLILSSMCDDVCNDNASVDTGQASCWSLLDAAAAAD